MSDRKRRRGSMSSTGSKGSAKYLPIQMPSPGDEGKFIDNKPIQVLKIRGKTGKPFADNCFITLESMTNSFVRTAGNTDSAGRHMRLQPACVNDALGDASTTVQPLYFDQLYAIWNEAIVAKANIRWTCRPNTTDQNDFTEEGWYMIMVHTPGQAEDTIINAASLTAAGARGPELLKHNTSGAQIKWRYNRPTELRAITGKVRSFTLTMDFDAAKTLGVTATDYLADDNNYYLKADVYSTDSPHTHCYIMTGNGSAWTSAAVASTHNQVSVTQHVIFKNLADVAQSTQ